MGSERLRFLYGSDFHPDRYDLDDAEVRAELMERALDEVDPPDWIRPTTSAGRWWRALI